MVFGDRGTVGVTSANRKNRGTRPRAHRDDLAAGRSTCCNIVGLAAWLKAVAPKADTSCQDIPNEPTTPKPRSYRRKPPGRRSTPNCPPSGRKLASVSAHGTPHDCGRPAPDHTARPSGPHPDASNRALNSRALQPFEIFQRPFPNNISRYYLE